MDEADEHPACDEVGLARNHRVQQRAVGMLRGRRLRIMAGDHMVGQQPQRLGIAPRGEILERADRMWLAATRVRIAPGSMVSRRTGSPVVTAASARVVGTPSAAMASLTMYSRSTGPSAARPSPSREKGVRPEPLSWMSRRVPSARHHLAEQDGTAVAELWHEVAELVPGIGERDRRRALGNAVAGKDLDALGAGQFVGVEPEALGQPGIHPHQPWRGHRRRIEARV